VAKSATSKLDGQQWAENLVRRVGLAMKKTRGSNSAKWLSDKTAELGYRVSPSVIAKLDSGHRGSVLGVAELMVLAAALNIPPGLMLFPEYPTGNAEFLPGRTSDTKAALDWFSGAGRLPTEGPFDASTDAATINAGTELVALVRRYDEVARAFFFTQQGLALRATQDDPTIDRSLLEQQMREFEKRMCELADEIDDLARNFEITEKPR
jgi:hypothetical protein